jgi:hypothetical protein
VEGFLAGFSLAPKPLKGVDLFVVEHKLSTKLSIKEVLQAISTPQGLTGWLGQASEFLCHVGIKFTVIVEGEESKAVFTTVDIPRVIVFMVEALGEFEFNLTQVGDTTQVTLKVRRALAPGADGEWTEEVARRVNALEGVLKVD